jgi:hypothetical protein
MLFFPNYFNEVLDNFYPYMHVLIHFINNSAYRSY